MKLLARGCLCLALLLCLAAAASVRAAMITWSAPVSITGDADVTTNGTLVYAYDEQNTPVTLNGVSFAAGSSSTSLGGNVGLAGFAGAVTGTFGGGGSAPWSGLSPGYQSLLAGGAYGNSGVTGTVTLSNLVASHAYQVQLWFNDSRLLSNTTNRTETVSAGGNSVTLAYNTTYAAGGLGQSILGAFVADGASQTITLTPGSPAGSNSAQINALQLRDQGPTLTRSIPAFPGAEGYGALASGARGGSVYHVTSLADSGPGTFRDAVSQPYRTIVFDVGGVIVLQSRCYAAGNVTIAGQTAPGQGICIYSNSVYFNTQYSTNYQGTNYEVAVGSTNLICRHVRFRQGINAGPTSWSLALLNTKGAILDHCSVEVGDWQTMCITWGSSPPGLPPDMASNVTVQYCLVGAGLNNQMGCLVWGAPNVTFHHNLWIDDGARDPKIDDQNAQIINDVVYNPQLGIYGDGTEVVDFVGNYHITGPSSPGSEGIYIDPAQYGGGYFYYTNNLLDQNVNGRLDGLPLVTNASFNPQFVSATPYCTPPVPVTIDSPQLAYYKVGAQAGCSLARDPLDLTLINQLLSLGKQGQTYTNEAQFGPMVVNGGLTLPDTDQDGMPDQWELATGANYQVPDNNVVATNGYTLLENYLNWLAAPHIVTSRNLPAAAIDLYAWSATFTNQASVYTVFNAVNGTATLAGNRFVTFTPGTNFIGLGAFSFSVQGLDGTTMTNTVGVLVTPVLPPASLVWRGDNAANVWQLYTTNDWFNGTFLQAFNGSDNVTFDNTGSSALPVAITGSLAPASLLVNSTNNYTFGGSGQLTGNFTLVKTNSGVLSLLNSNLFTGGVILNGGVLALTNNPGAAGPGVIALNNGILYSGAIANTISNAANTTNAWWVTGAGNVSPPANLAGSGTLYVIPTNTSVFTPVGNWSGFGGTLIFAGNYAQCRLFGNNTGSAAAAFDLGANGFIFDRNGGITVQFGSLTGGAAAVVSGATSVAAGTTFAIGALNTSTTFAGKLADGSLGSSSLLKVGTGTFTLAGTNTLSGGTTVSNGTLLITGTLANVTNAVTVAAGATLSGTGNVSGAVTVLAGGNLSPGNPTGTLALGNSLNLAAGARVNFTLGTSTNSARVAVTGNLTLGGALNVTNLAGFRPGTNTLFTSTGALAGNLALGAMPAGYAWLLATNVAGQVNLVAARPVITSTWLLATNWVILGSGGLAASNYYLLATTNLSLPLANWTRLATNQFDAFGNFAITNPPPAAGQAYFLLQMP